AGEVAAAHLGTPAGTGRPAAFEISGNPDPVYLSHARILPETRGRRQQRIEWSVVFEGAATSTLYVQAMNFSETADVVITEARIAEVGAMVVDTVVEDSNFAPFNLDGANPFTDDWHDVTHGATSPITTGTPAHTFPLNAATLHQMFTLGGEALAGGATGLLGTLERNNATLTNTDSSTPISTITLEWDGDFGPLADLLAIELWQFQSTWNATTEQYDHAWVNTGTMERVYTGDSFDGWDADGSGISIFPVLADEDDIFMTTRVWNDVTSDWDLVEFDDLTPWIATFVLEFYYELANG
ncbi:MAG: hypothetical protein FWF80_05720, partial [Defluviitaleaceae bacterium]|nr:hypothetical protein [Defluviitaleaceae bacterium]